MPSSSSFIVVDGNKLVTRPLTNKILHGLTRRAILKLAECGDIVIEERLYSVEEAKAADEAILTSASSFVTPIIEIDGQPVGTGKPGPITQKLQALYFEQAERGDF